MNICTGGKGPLSAHEEIVYDGPACPLCEAMDTIKEMRDEIATLEIEG